MSSIERRKERAGSGPDKSIIWEFFAASIKTPSKIP
jgi:hypothetical protein